MRISRSSPPPAAPARRSTRSKVVRADVILLDVEMPGASGLEALPDILRAGRRRARADRLLDGRGRRRDDGARARPRRRRHLAQARHRQFRRPLQPRCSPSGCAGSAAPSANPMRPRSAPRRAADPAARHAGRRRWAASLSAPRPAASTPCSNSCARCPARIGAPILVTQHLPAVFMPYFARQLESASGRAARVAEDGDAAGRRPHPRRARATPISASSAAAARSGSGSTASARRRAACRRPIRCSPRSPKPTATSGVGVMLSGMGRDGLVGSRRLVESGGAMLAQDRRQRRDLGHAARRRRSGARLGGAAAGRARPPDRRAGGGAAHGDKRLLAPHPGEPARGAHRPAARA